MAIAWGLLHFFSSCAKGLLLLTSIGDSDFSELSLVPQMCGVFTRSIFLSQLFGPRYDLCTLRSDPVGKKNKTARQRTHLSHDGGLPDDRVVARLVDEGHVEITITAKKQ